MRKSKGLSQLDLGNQLGISRVSVSLIETGKARPTLQIVKGLSKLFDIDMERLVSAIDLAHLLKREEPAYVKRIESKLKDIEDFLNHIYLQGN